MDTKTAFLLDEMTGAFYEKHAASFSNTRQHAWEGWERVIKTVSATLRPDAQLLDVGCGNLRFERFLAYHPELESASYTITAIDRCYPLVHLSTPSVANPSSSAPAASSECTIGNTTVQFEYRELARALANDNLSDLCTGAFTLCVCFAVMHHLPLATWRTQLLDTLFAAVKPGGMVAVSFWQFLKSERMATKASHTLLRTPPDILNSLDIDAGDRLLDWQGADPPFRFCHSFSDAEIDALIAKSAPNMEVVDDFMADGKDVPLNRYVIWRRLC